MAKTKKIADSGRKTAVQVTASGSSTDTLVSKMENGNGNVNGNGNGNGNGDCGNGKLRCKSLVIDGTKYRTRLNHKFENRRPWEYPNKKYIVSQIPGTIIKIDVKVGQKVVEGEQMLVLEAMKMKNKILFHTGGTVQSIHVTEGEKIPKNFLMVELK